MERNCSKCALQTLRNRVCFIFNKEMNDEQGCPYFTTEVKYCDLCGSPILDNMTIEEVDGRCFVTCQRCAQASACFSCKMRNDCAFINDQTCPEPPVILVEKRQGNMYMQTQTINPKRIQATCAAGCKCYRPEGLEDGTFCMKSAGCGCNNYEHIWRNVK